MAIIVAILRAIGIFKSSPERICLKSYIHMEQKLDSLISEECDPCEE